MIGPQQRREPDGPPRRGGSRIAAVGFRAGGATVRQMALSGLIGIPENKARAVLSSAALTRRVVS